MNKAAEKVLLDLKEELEDHFINGNVNFVERYLKKVNKVLELENGNSIN